MRRLVVDYIVGQIKKGSWSIMEVNSCDYITNDEKIAIAYQVAQYDDPWEIAPRLVPDDDTYATPTQDKCTCDMGQLMREGCRCGALERERGNK